MKSTAWLTLIQLFAASIGYSQTELQENVRYEGNTRLAISQLGLAFTIPAGWYGGVASGSPFLILADESNEVSIIITADEMKEESMAGELQQQISLDEGISISPLGTIRKEGKRWWGDYKINGATVDMKCYVEVKLGDHGIGVGCFVMAYPSAVERGKKGASDFLRSIAFTAPVKPQAAKAAGITQPWNEYLKGKSLKYYYTQGDFSDTDFIYLCSNGTFTRNKSSVSGGSTGSASMWGGNQGTWSATGQGDDGMLVLRNRDGSRTEFKIEYKEGTKGRGIYLNGYRYYTEQNNQCN